jgi:hypothetical protein
MKLLHLVAIAFSFLLFAASARPARAQVEIATPITSGDQLIFFYDATEGHVPFLVVSNISQLDETVDVAWYSQDLSQRIATQTLPIKFQGNVVLDGSTVVGVSGHAGLTVVTPIDDSGRPLVPHPFGDTLASAASGSLVGGFTLADLSTGGAFGSNPIGRIAVTADGSRAAAGSTVDGTTIRYQRIAPIALVGPFYFNPNGGVPVATSVVLAAFQDHYGASGFDILQASVELDYAMADASGKIVLETSDTTFAGVTLTSIQSLAGDTPLNSSGKVVFRSSTVSLPTNANLFGLVSQSLGTFGVGQVMPGYFGEPAK